MVLLWIGELLLLFLTSRKISTTLFSLFFNLTLSSRLATLFLAAIFFVGTAVHELAHFLMAKVLFVRTGKIELVPVLHQDGLKLGSVQIEKTDPIRRLLIGMAPVIAGSALISVGTYYLLPFILQISFTGQYFLLAAGYIFGIFVITNTMFSSKKDMEGAVGLFLLLALCIMVLYVAGKGMWIESGIRYFVSRKDVMNISLTLSKLLLVPLAINLLIVIASSLIRKRY
jgi:hypothetical protein